MAMGDSGQGAAPRSATHSSCSGGSSELAVYGTQSANLWAVSVGVDSER
jgi:hypothetical protein